MRKFLISALVLVSALAGSILIVPQFIDWNAYRRDVAAVIVQATGREVTIAGDLELSILPLPRLTVRKVGIASVDGAIDRDLLWIRELRLEPALGALLTGRIAARSLTLMNPVLTLETLADGRHSWDLAPDEPGWGAERVKSAIPVDMVSISNGTIAWRTGTAERRQLRAIEATLTARGGTGPIQLQGTAVFEDMPVRVAASSRAAGPDGLSAVSAVIDLGGTLARLAATGRVNWARRLADGTVQVTVPNARTLGRALSADPAPPIPAWKIEAESPLIVDRSSVELPEIAVAYGEVRGTGRARFEVGGSPALSAELVVAVLDLDHLLTATSDEGSTGEPTAEPARKGDTTSWASNVTADLDLSIRAARWRDGVIRDVGATIRQRPQGLSIDRLAMTLPGGTDVNLTGFETQHEPDARMHGDLAVIADNFRATLLWAGAPDDAMPGDRLRSFSLTSRIAVTSNAVHLADIAARLDATRLTGAATIARQARPSFGLRLALDRLELDAYLPESWHPAGTPGTEDGGGGFDAAALFDANLLLSVETLTFAGNTASQALLDAQLFDRDLLLRKLSASDLSGGAVTVSGTITDVPGSPNGDLTLTAEVRDAERFFGLMTAHPVPVASRIGRIHLTGHAKGSAGAADVGGTLIFGAGEMRAEGTFAGTGPDARLELAVTARHGDADELLRLLAPNRSDGGIGAMSLALDLTRTAQAVKLSNLKADLGDMQIAGSVDIGFGGVRPSVVADLVTGVLDLDQLLPRPWMSPRDATLPSVRGSARWSRQSADLSGLQSFDIDVTVRADGIVSHGAKFGDFDLHASLTDAVVTIDRLTGSLFGGRVEAAGRLDARGSDPLVSATIAGRDIAAAQALDTMAQFDRLAGPISFSLSLSAAGSSPYGLVSSLTGHAAISGNLQAQQYGVRPFPVGPAGDALDLLLKAFASSPAALSGAFPIADGHLEVGNLAVSGEAARSLTRGAVDIAGWRIDWTTTLLRFRDGQRPGEAIIEVDGPLDDPAFRLSGAIEDIRDAAPAPQAAPVLPVEPATPSAADEPDDP
ncbi:MAG: AsmA family protein [Rhodospirillales bacterium]|nr:MAG: AsmA family protein [Rhodospirillales bacterium]